MAYVIAVLRRDANGNPYYDSDYTRWTTAELAHQWQRYTGEPGEVIADNHPLLLAQTLAESEKRMGVR